VRLYGKPTHPNEVGTLKERVMAKSKLGPKAPASWVWGALFSVLLPSLALPTSALAQDDPMEFGDPDASAEENADATGMAPEDTAMSETLPTVDASADQWFVGAQWRQLIIPAFVQQVFLDEAPTVFQPTFQIVATKRNSENFSLVFGLGYASYAFDGLYRAKGDPVEDTEWLESNLGLLHGTVSALWATKLNDMLDFEYGIGGEIGVVLGELRRTEATRSSGSWRACDGPGLPDFTYCGAGPVAYDEKGEHYNVVEKRIPPVFLLPTLFQAGLRITPTPEVAIKIEAAYATLAFWFGASVHLNLSVL